MNTTGLPAQACRWRVFDYVAELEQAATATILEMAAQAIAERGAFHLVLAGGTTPRRVYERLAACTADWGNWHIYFGDERCLPPDHAERNSRMALDVWLSAVTIPQQQIHIMPTEQGAEQAASAYAKLLAAIPLFDLVLLGLGEDGHTASLFPMQEWERAISWPPVLPVHDAPKPPPDRVSLSPERLSQARRVLFLVTGQGKAEAVRDWRAGVQIPASRVGARQGVDVFADSAAAP